MLTRVPCLPRNQRSDYLLKMYGESRLSIIINTYKYITEFQVTIKIFIL